MTVDDPLSSSPESVFGFELTKSVRAVGLIVLAAGIVVVYGATSLQVFNPDPYVFGACARQLLAGGTLYADVWQDKPPLEILSYWIPQLLAPGSYLGLQLFLGVVLVSLGAFAAMQARSVVGAWLSASMVQKCESGAGWCDRPYGKDAPRGIFGG